MQLATFQTEKTGDAVIVHVHGEIDLSNAAELSAAVTRTAATGQSPPERVWVDLREVSYFDSAGLNTLFALNENLRAAGRSLGVVAPQRHHARRVLDLVQADRVMPVTETIP